MEFLGNAQEEPLVVSRVMTPCGSPGVGCSEGSGARLRKSAGCGTVLDLTALKKRYGWRDQGTR